MAQITDIYDYNVKDYDIIMDYIDALGKNEISSDEIRRILNKNKDSLFIKSSKKRFERNSRATIGILKDLVENCPRLSYGKTKNLFLVTPKVEEKPEVSKEESKPEIPQEGPTIETVPVYSTDPKDNPKRDYLKALRVLAGFIKFGKNKIDAGTWKRIIKEINISKDLIPVNQLLTKQGFPEIVSKRGRGACYSINGEPGQIIETLRLRYKEIYGVECTEYLSIERYVCGDIPSLEPIPLTIATRLPKVEKKEEKPSEIETIVPIEEEIISEYEFYLTCAVMAAFKIHNINALRDDWNPSIPIIILRKDLKDHFAIENELPDLIQISQKVFRQLGIEGHILLDQCPTNRVFGDTIQLTNAEFDPSMIYNIISRSFEEDYPDFFRAAENHFLQYLAPEFFIKEKPQQVVEPTLDEEPMDISEIPEKDILSETLEKVGEVDLMDYTAENTTMTTPEEEESQLIETPKLKGVKVVGYIDLNEIDKKSKPKTNKEEQVEEKIDEETSSIAEVNGEPNPTTGTNEEKEDDEHIDEETSISEDEILERSSFPEDFMIARVLEAYVKTIDTFPSDRPKLKHICHEYLMLRNQILTKKDLNTVLVHLEHKGLIKDLKRKTVCISETELIILGRMYNSLPKHNLLIDADLPEEIFKHLAGNLKITTITLKSVNHNIYGVSGDSSILDEPSWINLLGDPRIQIISKPDSYIKFLLDKIQEGFVKEKEMKKEFMDYLSKEFCL